MQACVTEVQVPELEGKGDLGAQSNESDHMLDSTPIFTPGPGWSAGGVDMDSWQHQLMNEASLLAVVPAPPAVVEPCMTAPKDTALQTQQIGHGCCEL